MGDFHWVQDQVAENELENRIQVPNVNLLSVEFLF